MDLPWLRYIGQQPAWMLQHRWGAGCQGSVMRYQFRKGDHSCSTIYDLAETLRERTCPG